MTEADDNSSSNISNIDRTVHEPARLVILAYLHAVESADFLFLMHQTGLTFGNLSSHMSKLEAVGYITVIKRFAGKKPQTMLRITERGRRALLEYQRYMQELLDKLPEQTSGLPNRNLYCPSCDYPIQENDNYCGFCGASVADITGHSHLE